VYIVFQSVSGMVFKPSMIFLGPEKKKYQKKSDERD